MTRNSLAWLPLFAVPLVLHNETALTILIFSFILGMLAISFNVIFGYTGQMSMFHAAAFGLSAYVTHLAMTHLGVSWWVGVGLAMAFVLALSVVVGTICFRFRLKEFYFAIATMAFSEMVRLVVLNWSSVTNGSMGINLTTTPSVFGYAIKGTLPWYYFSLVMLMVSVVVCTRVVHSWMGRCFAAIRLNDELADTLGINVFVYKMAAFLVGNAGAAIAGAMYAYYLGYVEAEYLSIGQSLAIVAMVLLGGRGSIIGPVVGAVVLTALPHVSNLGAEYRVMLYGCVLIFTILLLPQGIVGTVGRLLPLLRGAPPVTAKAGDAV